MKALIVTTSYAPQVGGIQTHVYKLSKKLNQSGVDIRVLLITDDQYMPKNSESDPEIIKKQYKNKKTILNTKSEHIYRHVVEEIENFEPDIIHGHTFWTTYPLLPISLRPDYPPVVVTFHSSQFLELYYSDSIKSKFKSFLGRWTTDIGIAPSAELADAAKETVTAPVFRIPNGVDINEFKPCTDISLSDIEGVEINTEPEFVVLTTRRFEQKNGMEYLVKSIPDTDQNVFFILLGEGSQRKELKSWIKSNGISDRVHMPGSVPNEQIGPYYQVADLSVLPSLKEAISISALESMSSGTPVIGTKVGGLPELIDHGHNGWLVEPRSSEAISNAIETLRTDPDTVAKLSTNARETILENYSWDVIGERTLEIYESVA